MALALLIPDSLRSVQYPPYMEDTKLCVQCGEAKPAESGFYRSKRNSDGRDSYCKACRDGRSAASRGPRGPVGRPPKPFTPEKECSRCREVKNTKRDFYPRREKGEGKYDPFCKACRAEMHAAYIARPEVAAKLRQQERNRRSGSWTRPPRREPIDADHEVCTMCNEDKPLDEFHAQRNGRNGKDSACKECKRVMARERNKDPKVNERDHRRAKERQFGLAPGQYDGMLEAQGHACAICRRPAGSPRLHVDHCHTTGEVRGLLCTQCNVGLGSFADDTERMAEAIRYLTENRKD